MNEIEKYYNKFNEDKRLNSRHGKVEFAVSMAYIKKYLKPNMSIIDIGAGTGKYSIALESEGYDVTAVELVKKNLSVIKEKAPQIKSYLGNALNLKRFKDESFDIVILFGPMYHLFSFEDKIKALNEAKRIVKKGEYIFAAYLLKDYAIIRHGIMDNNFGTNFDEGKIDKDFCVVTSEKDLYSYVTLSDIEQYNKTCALKREKIFSPDGPTDYIRNYVNKLSEEDFNKYLEYVFSICENSSMLGASSHIVDILKKE